MKSNGNKQPNENCRTKDTINKSKEFLYFLEFWNSSNQRWAQVVVDFDP